ncbi:hypothetical protein ORJ00_18560, partial [Rheinheimera baltica]|uniref:hypothetical protein n=1 Tax=Rheinheimera baltica TaxID=67576 RepID=UPI00273ED0B1
IRYARVVHRQAPNTKPRSSSGVFLCLIFSDDKFQFRLSWLNNLYKAPSVGFLDTKKPALRAN